MKLLVVHNGWIVTDKQRTILGAHLSRFLQRCSNHFDAVSCLASSPNFDKSGEVLDTSVVKAIPVKVYGANRCVRMLSYCLNINTIINAVRDSDFLYVFYPGNLSLLALAASRLLHKPYGIYLRGEIGKHSLVWKRIMSNARFVIATGGVLADAASCFCKDVEQAIPMCSLPEDIHARGMPLRTKGPWRLLYVGSLTEQKGTLDLLEAMSILQKRDVNCRLDLVGENSLDIIPKCVEQLEDYISIIGPVYDKERMRQYYCSADLFCFPSHNEGFPRVLYEAMAYGVPIVTTFVGSIPSIMEDGINCLRAEVRSPDKLAEIIEKALYNPQLREYITSNGYLTVKPIISRMLTDSHDIQMARKIMAYASKKTD